MITTAKPRPIYWSSLGRYGSASDGYIATLPNNTATDAGGISATSGRHIAT